MASESWCFVFSEDWLVLLWAAEAAIRAGILWLQRAIIIGMQTHAEAW